MVVKFVSQDLQACANFDQPIESEDYVLESPVNTNVRMFFVKDNRKVKFLPRLVIEKLPNLKNYYVKICGLTALRNFNFKNMRKLERLNLDDNRISKIESAAFNDLVNLRVLELNENLIETFNGRLFEKMVNVEEIWLKSNKIRFLSPTTFMIPRGKLYYVDMRGNVCKVGFYNQNLGKLGSDISVHCRG